MLLPKLFLAVGLSLLLALAGAAQEATSFKIIKKGSGKRNIILLPGFASAPQVWDETVAGLGSGATYYVVGWSGFAGSQAEPEPGMGRWENELVGYIKANRIKDAVLIGHSLGGVLALEIAAQHPEAVSKVVVVDALPSLGAFCNPAFKRSEAPDCQPLIDQFTGMSESQFYQMQKAGTAQLVTDARRADEILGWSVKSDRKTLGKIYCELLNTDLRERLAEVKCPALILLEPSFKAREADVREQYRQLKNADLRYAAEGRHFMMYDEPEWLIREVKEFLAR